MRNAGSIVGWMCLALGVAHWPGGGNVAAQDQHPGVVVIREIPRAATPKEVRAVDMALGADSGPLTSLAVTITGPKDAYVDQPMSFQVQVVNASDKPTLATEIRILAFSLDEGFFSLKVEALQPKESRTLSVTATPRRIGLLDMGAFFGKSLPEAIECSYRSLAQVDVRFDPSAPLRSFLPTAPQEQSGKPRLPPSLDQVPEVAYEAAPGNLLKPWQVHDHAASTIDKIIYLSQKNSARSGQPASAVAGSSDGYMQALVSERRDLAGLPFIMGDACRMNKEQRHAFHNTMQLLRIVRTSKNHIPPREDMFDSGLKPSSADKSRKVLADQAEIAGLTQVVGPESESLQFELVKRLTSLRNVEATQALAKMAIFCREANIRSVAVEALRDRPAGAYTDILVQGLSYPWPGVARAAGSAIADLGRVDLIPQLREVLDRPDPRSPEVRVVQGKKVQVVRELVRINHHRNCLLCHAPGTDAAAKDLAEDGFKVKTSLTAQVLLPNMAFPVTYYEDRARPPDILVRVDVTYLRQDFSRMMRVPEAAPWPEEQRFDFLVRTRVVSAQDADAYLELLRPRPGARSPCHDAARTALDALTGLAKE